MIKIFLPDTLNQQLLIKKEIKAMNCPNCDTVNEPTNEFCINCGQPLQEPTGEAPQTPRRVPPAPPPLPPQPMARTVSELLQVLTIRMVVILVGLWLLKVILNWLPFIQDLRIPGSPIASSMIIDTIVYLIIVVLLVSYSRMLWVLWPQVLPRYREAATFLVMLIYIIILVVLYFAAEPLIRALVVNPGDILTVLQIILFVIALLLLVYALVIVYQRLPFWLPSVRQQVNISAPRGDETACLYCGNLNNAGAKFCSICGQPLSNK
jgi:RNA polymerase subunit RPABC4/transcription elongation factor Spt4